MGKRNITPQQRAKDNIYKSGWRKARRQTNKEFTVAYTPQELKIIHKEAKAHNQSNTRYIREAALLYSQQTFMAIDQKTVNEIYSLLTQIYTSIQDVGLNDERISGVEALLAKLEQIEQTIETAVERPDTVEQRIAKLIMQEPKQKEALITLIQTTAIDR